MPPKKTVLYCTVIPVGRSNNGGSLVCGQNIQRLSELEGIDLHVCTIIDIGSQRDAAEFLRHLPATHHPINLSANAPPDASGLRKWLPSLQWPFSFEDASASQSSVDAAFGELLGKLEPHIVIIEYLFTALFIRQALSSASRLVVITQNSEAVFYEQLRRLGRLPQTASRIASFRLGLFERTIYQMADTVVAFSAGDLPAYLGKSKATVIEPVLDVSDLRWSKRSNNRIAYVGNIAHYPNFLAIKWIAEHFAPLLLSRDPNITIRVVGADAGDVDPNWKLSNIDYLGVGDNKLVENELTDCSLFIAPIENNFGSKMKVLQCLSHGTPVIATKEALSGIPFREQLPQIRLANPLDAAALCVELLSETGVCQRLSEKQSSLYQQMVSSRSSIWKNLLDRIASSKPKIVRRHARRRARHAGLARFASVRAVNTSRPWRGPVEIGLKSPVGMRSSGLHGVEVHQNLPLRWTNGSAELGVPLNSITYPKHLKYEIWGIPLTGDPYFRILVQGELIGEGVITGDLAIGTLDLPDLKGLDWISIRIESPRVDVPGDGRGTLGLALRSITLIP
ncbi:glycosyltransferase [Methylobacterium sp. E-066]|uniref:glycosyltransferase n=1 Tax=Methylobacterium sp. E-066 TaxID=2836584 RepID=UPI001FBA954E|nr:glycosyltransferase [Methylobacterium sp. E-066]MCJ2142945.1 glycosyltransferase [Methylobacterium sp. E-066]